MKGLILGAGFTGLAAGIKTGFPIFEMTGHAGGICQSYRMNGFEFMTGGGHWIFGKGIGLDYIKTLVPVREHVRKAGVYFNHTFPYPIQTTGKMQVEIKENQLTSLKWWLNQNFGKELCNMFFFPFNDKYTAGLYDEVIQYDEFKSPPAGSVGFVSTFCDPEDGLSSLVEKMAEQCTIHYKKKAVQILEKEQVVIFSDGTRYHYDKLISTIPLNNLLRLMGRKDYDLPYTSVLVINIGAEKDTNTPDDHWLYVPYCKSGFYRLGFYSNIDARKAPDGKVGLSVEMAFKDVEYKDLDIEKITHDVVSELQAWRFIGRVNEVDPTWVRCAYTWLRSKESRDRELEWLKDRNIISTGRYGKWHFQGMVDSIKDGFEVSV